MSTLTTMLAKLSATAEAVRELEVSDQLSHDIQLIADDLQRERAFLEPLTKTLKVLRRKEMLPKTKSGQALLAKELDRVQSEFKKDTKFLIDDRFNPGEIRAKLRNVANQLQQTLGAAWQEYIRSHYSPPDDGLLQQLERLPNLASHVKTIRGLIAVISKRGGQLPTTDEDVSAFDEQTDRLAEAMKRLKLPEAVRTFLVAVSQGGASLDLLDGSVREWLEENGLRRQFVIRSLGTVIPSSSVAHR